MKDDYTLEFLENKFKEHSEEFEDRHHSNPYKDENAEYFNLSNALHVICKRLNEIKNYDEDQEICSDINIEEYVRNISGVSTDLMGKNENPTT
jgi:hypothetical protein